MKVYTSTPWDESFTSDYGIVENFIYSTTPELQGESQTFSLSGNFWRAFLLSALHEKLEFLDSFLKTLHKFRGESSPKNAP